MINLHGTISPPSCHALLTAGSLQACCLRDVQSDTKVENFPACWCEPQRKGGVISVQPAHVECRRISQTSWCVRSQPCLINSDMKSPKNPLFRHLLYLNMPGSKSPLNMDVQHFCYKRPHRLLRAGCGPHVEICALLGWRFLTPLKMGPIGCPETSVMIYQYTLRNNPEEHKSLLHRDGSLYSLPNSLNYSVIFIVHTKFTNVATGAA